MHGKRGMGPDEASPKEARVGRRNLYPLKGYMMDLDVCKGAECTDIQVMQHEQFGTLRAMMVDGEWRFMAKDVCEALDIRTNSIRSILDDDEVSTLNDNTIVINRGKSPLVVTEAGLYSLIMRSRKPEAKAFRRWITHVVLPQLRRTGVYVATASTAGETIERLKADVAAIVQRETSEAIVRCVASVADLAQRCATEAEAKAEALEVEVTEAKAEASKANAVLRTLKGANGGMTITEAARHITAQNKNVKTKDVFATLRASGIICKRSNAPTQYGIRCGYVDPAPMSTHKGSDGTPRLNRQYARLTAKGVAWLAEQFSDAHSLPEKA